VRALAPAAVLEAWERGAARHPVDRALVLLAAAFPGASRAELAALPLGERDAALLRLRRATVGAELAAFTECAACGERLELSLDSDALLSPGAGGAGPWEAAAGGWRVVFRLPDSRDLAAAAACASAAEARRVLAARCVVEAVGPGGAASPGALPEALIGAMAGRMAEVAPPEADLSLALECPACGHAWEAVLDVAAFFWAEVQARARRLLREIDVLARAYHWSEAEILALSPARRGAYIELVQG
jgi:hypothetical protein